MPFEASAHTGTIHRFTPRLVAFEHNPQPTPTHTLLWIGGLGDGLLTVRYPTTLAASLPPTWSLAQVLLSSAYNGWGTSSIARDASQLAACVSYFRTLRPGRKVVIMGHSTGSQDCVEYVVGKGAEAREHVDGVILQAPASDREGLMEGMSREEYDESVHVAREFVAEGRGTDALPSRVLQGVFRKTPVSAERWLSLASPEKDGDDDLFSSDLGDEKLKTTFGRWHKDVPLCVLYSGADEYVPKFVEKEALVRRWAGFVKEAGGVVDEENGGVIPDAHHNYDSDPPEVVERLITRVKGFLERIDSGHFSKAAHL